jgi:putative addiction module component (TIGR02574 family)
MTLTTDQIRLAALNLSASEREALGEELLMSISEDDRAAVEAAWLEEAKRRSAAFKRGETTANPVDEVIDRILQKGRS